MKKEDFFEVLGELDDDIVSGAKTPVKENANSKIRRSGWLKWGAAAACLAVVLAVGVPYISDICGLKGGPGQGDPVPPLKVIEYEGAYYEIIDMANTELLDTYHLPREITVGVVGDPLGTGLDGSGKQTERIMYQYLPYADIVTVTGGLNQERAQRAVYVVEEGEGYSFALFCNFIHLDSNTHEEASELFAVYGVDEAEDIAGIAIGGETVSDSARIQEIFDSLYHSRSMGNDDYQDTFFKGMSEEDQQALSIELADSMMKLRIITTDGVAINNLCYYPTINCVCWALNYYQLNDPIQ